MATFKIVPLPLAVANSIKNTKHDAFGNEVIELLAKGRGPCRLSLKPFAVGADIRLLFSYSPFEIKNAFDQPGPIFINKDDVLPYSDVHRFPAEIKADKINFPLTLIGYNRKQHMVFTKLVADADVDELIAVIFEEHNNIEYLHARNAEAGCYICKIERV